MTHREEGTAPTDLSAWERGLNYATDYGPYLTLGLGAALALAVPEPGQNRLVTLALVALAAAWVFVMFTRAGGRLSSQARARVYFGGFLVLGAVLLAHHPFFFIYPVAGFFQAALLKPAPATFVGVFFTSLVVNGLIVLENQTAQNLWIYAVVVVVQTLAIALGVIGSEKIAEFNEERRQAVVDLEKALEENEGLHAQLVAQAREAGVADERQRMGREIHDTISQGLVGVITQLEAADNVIADRPALERHLANARRIARDSLDEARRSVRAATPLPLEGRTLSEAIGDVVDRWRTHNGISVEWSVAGDPVPLHPEIEVTLLRVVQESLANVARHAEADRVGVTLSYIGDVVTVDVRDDGVGFTSNGGREGFGLSAMKARVEEMAGTMQIETEPGRGTAVSATLPGAGDD